MRSIAWCALSLSVALGAAAPAHAQVSWQGDFETGDTSQWRSLLNGMVDGRRYIDVVSDVVAEGTYAARVELHNDAVWPNGLKRVELNHRPADGRTAEGAELFFAWSFYLPETLPTDPSQTIGYWESDSSYQQLMAFRLSGTELSFVTRRPTNQVHWTSATAATPGEWHRIALRILWSTDAGTGEVDVWFDGTQVVEGASAATLADSNRTFTQVGLLRGAIEFSDVPVIYIDDAVEGDSLADVRPDDLPGALPPDAGVDAGGATADGGTSSGADAGRATDAGGTPGLDAGTATRDVGPTTDGSREATGGCGCRIASTRAPAPALGLLVLAVAAGARRRRRR